MLSFVISVAYGYLAQSHLRGAAAGLVLKVAYVVLRRPAVHGMEEHVRGGHYPVFEYKSSDLEGPEKIRIFLRIQRAYFLSA
jgi:hypothetical protein